MCYLIDLSYSEKKWEKITGFEYVRYYYWPYSTAIPTEIDKLIVERTFSSRVKVNSFWEENIIYYLKDDSVDDVELTLSSEEMSFAGAMIEELAPFNASELTKISYNVGKLKEWWAKLGGTEHFKEKIL
jgi:hypothetical protein